MSDPTGWELVAVGVLQGLGLLAVVWAAHQIRKGLYYHRKWRFCLNLVAGGMPAGSSFENALKNAEGEPCYWTPMEDAGTGTVPGWYYAPTPMSTKKPAWWSWMKRSFVLAYKHQQWKPAEYLTIAQWAERFGGPASGSVVASPPAPGVSVVGGLPILDASPALLDLWGRLPSNEGQADLLFQFADGEHGWLVGVEGRRLVRVATGRAVADLK